MTQGATSDGSKYSPNDNNGLKKDGTPDKRKNPEHGFGGDRQAASEAGTKGGHTQPDEVYKPSEHGGVKKDGTEDSRTNPEHGFGGDREAASAAGKKGGSQ